MNRKEKINLTKIAERLKIIEPGTHVVVGRSLIHYCCDEPMIKLESFDPFDLSSKYYCISCNKVKKSYSSKFIGFFRSGAGV